MKVFKQNSQSSKIFIGNFWPSVIFLSDLQLWKNFLTLWIFASQPLGTNRLSLSFFIKNDSESNNQTFSLIFEKATTFPLGVLFSREINFIENHRFRKYKKVNFQNFCLSNKIILMPRSASLSKCPVFIWACRIS